MIKKERLYPKPQISLGYTPKELAFLTHTEPKKIRRLLRKNKIKGIQIENRWYIKLTQTELGKMIKPE